MNKLKSLLVQVRESWRLQSLITNSVCFKRRAKTPYFESEVARGCCELACVLLTDSLWLVKVALRSHLETKG